MPHGPRRPFRPPCCSASTTSWTTIAASATVSTLAARHGGEEFALLLPETDLDGASQAAEVLRAALGACGIAHSGAALGRVSVSVGVAAAEPTYDDERFGELAAFTDEALYRTKSSGRDRVATATGIERPTTGEGTSASALATKAA